MNSAANESVHALSGAYVVDALDDDERTAFEDHLPGCHDCRAEVASLREAAALMADDVAMTPPPSLRDSVLSGISTIRPLPPGTSEEAAPVETTESHGVVVPMRRRRFRMASLAAAAAVLAAVGVGAVFQPWQDNQNPPVATMSPADQVLAAADVQKSDLDFNDGATATVYRSVSVGRAVLVTHDMAAPPKGKVFELWLRDEAGRMSPAGLMRTAGDNKVLLKGDATHATGVGITVEPAGGSPEPTTEPIALFELDKAEA